MWHCILCFCFTFIAIAYCSIWDWFFIKGRLWKSGQVLVAKFPKRTKPIPPGILPLPQENGEFKSKLIEINESDDSHLSISVWVFGKDVKVPSLYELFCPLLLKPSVLMVTIISWDSAGCVRQVWVGECKCVRGALLTPCYLLELLLPVP